ncbi:MAG: NAD-dependent epimerase/dehydratase family protein [Patescibacteria group bacterium]|jgi:nucleoside-diphosphate-sugar epimerase/lipopolysaccharide biosynthesis glycosyltransferase|nr:NAD-dependent epimerase/dehydratase family protein [Patescibacteria group bacterium]
MKINRLKNKNIVITGAEGYVGSSIIRKLRNSNVSIIALVKGDKDLKRKNKLSSSNIKYVNIDLFNKEKLFNYFENKKIDTLIHCAAVDGNYKFKKDNAKEIYDSNLKLFNNILDLVILKNIKDFMILSSTYVYRAFNNKSDYNYSLSKLEIEKKAKQKLKDKNINLYIPRIANIYGPGFDLNKDVLIPTLIKNVLNNKAVPIYGKGNQELELIYIDDLIEILLFILEKRKNGIIDISDKRIYTVKQVAKLIFKLENKKEDYSYIHSNLSFDNNSLNLKDRRFINKKRTNIENGLVKTINWFSDNYYSDKGVWKKKNNLLVSLADTNFVNAAKQLFASVYLNAGWDGDYMLISSSLKKEEVKDFTDRGIIVYQPELISTIKCGGGFYPPLLLSKLYLFKKEFKKYKNIVFLDADIIVNYSLHELLGSGFKSPQAQSFKLKNEFINNKEKTKDFRKKYNFRKLAFNTGVFSFNTNIINNNTFSEIIDLYFKYQDLYFLGEESALNLYYYNNWKKLPYTYNSSPDKLENYYGMVKERQKAFIMHFCRRVKPWEVESVYHKEWINNFNKFSEIDFRTLNNDFKIFSKQDQKEYYRNLRKNRLVKVLGSPYVLIDRTIGKIGLFIEKVNPKLYNFLKRGKNGK